MDKIQCYLLDVIELLPDGSTCYLQCPDIEDEITISLLQPTEYAYYQKIILKGLDRISFIERIKNSPIVSYLQV
ncbi:MAG: hypothetical protein ABI581_08045 [Sediminibacterium sp.]